MAEQDVTAIIRSLRGLHPGHQLITEDLIQQFKELGRQEGGESIIISKMFTPWTGWTWYATEFDPEDLTFFGAIHGLEKELGYFSLPELLEIRGPGGLRIERDLSFGNPPLSSVQTIPGLLDQPGESLCPDCDAFPGDEHDENCDVARCRVCGGQFLSCDCPDKESLPWEGEWPGLVECREYGLWCIRNPDGPGYIPCAEDEPGATEDLNRLHEQGRWNRERGRWVIDCAPP